MSQRLSFIVIGVQKGGTSSLDAILRLHPQIEMPRIKEIHFFDDEHRNWREIDVDFYHGHFDFSDIRKVRGEITPNYIYWQPALERIARYNPNIKIIAMFRDPIRRAYSQWQMFYSIFTEDLGFGSAIREGRKRLPAGFDGSRAARAYSYVERGFYGAQLQKVFSLFPRENVLLLKSEDFFRSQAAVVNRIHEFLGVPPQVDIPAVHDHQHAPIAFPTALLQEDVNHLREVFAGDMELFKRLSGLDVSDWLVATGTVERAALASR